MSGSTRFRGTSSDIISDSILMSAILLFLHGQATNVAFQRVRGPRDPLKTLVVCLLICGHNSNGISQGLMNAMPTLAPLARLNHQKPLHPNFFLKPLFITKFSSRALINTAKKKVAVHVPELNVPILKSL